MQTIRAYLTPNNVVALVVLVVIAALVVLQQPIPRELIDLLLALIGLATGLYVQAHKRS